MAEPESKLGAAALATKHEFPPEKVPSDCWDWITREDVTRHAFAAFEMARKSAVPPSGGRFLDETGYPWSGRDSFLEDLIDCFSMRIRSVAYGHGLGEHYGPAAERLKLSNESEGA